MIHLDAPVVAYRDWYTGKPYHPTALYSTANGYRWTPGPNVAECIPLVGLQDLFPHPDGIECPAEDCTCGLHGSPRVYETDRWVFDNQAWAAWGIQRPYITGAILMWGKLRSGGTVIRASHAQVVALLGDKQGDLAEMYGVPLVKTPEALRFFGTEFGDELSDEQLKELRA